MALVGLNVVSLTNPQPGMKWIGGFARSVIGVIIGDMPDRTPEELAESQSRKEEFKRRCLEASNELECDFFFYPQYVPSPDGSFRTMVTVGIMDKRGLGQKSPLSVPDVIQP